MISDLIGRSATSVTVKDYQYLGINLESGVVVLFTAPDYGMCVHVPDNYVGCWVGLCSAFWNEDEFVYLRGKIILDNYPESA